MEAYMIKALLFAVSLLHPHHKNIDFTPQEIDAMTRKAAVHVMAIRQATREIEENCPYVPELYFVAMHQDLDKIALDKDAGAPSFRQDFDNLEDDFHSLLGAIPIWRNMENI